MDRAERARVALVRGESRRGNITAALEGVADQGRLDTVSRVLVKPNFVSVDRQLAATHVDAIRAVLDFVRARYDGSIVVAEAAAMSPTWEGFRNFGYEALVEEYGIELVDLNADDSVPVRIYDRHLRPLTVYLARTAVEADYRISVGLPKTHDTVIVTLSIKNIVMGSLVNPQAVRRSGGVPGVVQRLARLAPKWMWQSGLAEWAKGVFLGRPGGSSKMAMHQGFPVINLNLALVAHHVWPHLVVIDGWQGMEGDGPGNGDPVDWRVALASTDPLAADVLTAHLMGFDSEQVGYLQYCRHLGLGVGEVGQIEVVGNVSPAGVRRSFAPSPTHERQLGWHLDGVERYLGA
ncbi:MAG: DUF362 domain-containing protein [Chloroflexota bacterium]|nr:DUF362 domain-containing protein [Chloroflexota bacterium]